MTINRNLSILAEGASSSGVLGTANGGTNSTATPTAGGVVYGTGTAQAITSAGTTGQFLSSNGSSAPSWVGAPASAMTLISTQNVTASSSFGWTGLSGYNTYILSCNPTTGTGSGICLLQVGTSGTGLLTSNYYFSTTATAATTNQSAVYLYLRGIFAGAVFTLNGMNSGYFSINGVCNAGTSSTSSSSASLSGFQSTTAGPYNQISIAPQSGTITGAFSLYGITS